ncbi:MAG: oligosaccharide flippase family protein [candidate division Zixibacteria bacterium]|nr:oligosaccharide flippase family protein [candidate division Zixibacteria bacterium]
MFEQLKKLGRHSLVYGFGILLTNSIAFVMIPIYTRFLTTADYGILEIINRTSEILGIILIGGLGLTVLRFYQDSDQKQHQNTVVSTAILWMLLFGSLALVVLFSQATSISQLLLGSGQYTIFIRLMLGTLYFDLFFIIPIVYIQAQVKSLLYILVSVGKFIVGVSLNIYFVCYLKIGIKGILTANLLNSALFGIVLLILTMQKVGIKFNLPLWKKMLVFALPFVPGSLFLFVLNNGDRYFLKIFCSNQIVGLYALGYKIGTLAVIFIMSPFVRVWNALMVEISRRDDFKIVFGRIFTYVMLSYAFVGLGLAVLNKELLMIMAGPSYWDASKIVPLIVLAYFFWAISLVTDAGFYIAKKTYYKPFLFGMAAAINILLYWYLIPRYNMLGAAWATVVAFAFFAGLSWRVVNRVFPVKYEYRRSLEMTLLAVLLYFASTFIKLENIWLQVGAKLLLVFGFPLILYFTGFLLKEEKEKIASLLKPHILKLGFRI